MYLGVFIDNPKENTKQLRSICKNNLLNILKHNLPQKYCKEGE